VAESVGDFDRPEPSRDTEALTSSDTKAPEMTQHDRGERNGNGNRNAGDYAPHAPPAGPDTASVRAYFRNIYDNVTSIATGLKITLKYCFQKTVTVQYPEQRLSFAPRYRGIHEFELDKCIACDMCAKACPVDCIYIDKSGPRKIDKKIGKVNPADPKNGQLLRYAIDYSKCLFCALCTEPCPTDCIHMGKLHDLSSYTREDVVVEFAQLDKQGLRTPIPLWMERNAEKIPWVKEEYDRVKGGKLATTAGDIPHPK
jgi:NADH-quinone oxidoreductase subunit I